MHLGVLSTVYLIIFLPLIASLFCSLLPQNKLSFLLTISCCLLIIFLSLGLFPEMFLHGKISNSAPISLPIIATEFSINITSLVFILLLSFLKLINLLHNANDLFGALKKDVGRAFYPVFLLNLFAVIGLCSTDSLINFLLFVEIYSLGFFAIVSISNDHDLRARSADYFSVSAASSLLIIFCFIVIYMTYGEIKLSEIASAMSATAPQHSGFAALLFIVTFVAFVAKFFPLRFYFAKLESRFSISSFLAAESIFTKSLLGIFSLTTLLCLFNSTKIFQQFHLKYLIAGASLLLIFFSIFKLYRQKNSRLIVAYFCYTNIGFVLLCLAFPSFESLQAMFFFLLNFTLVNLALLLYCNFFDREIAVVATAPNKNYAIIFSGIIIVLFIIAFPMTILFFANWHFAMAFFNKAPQSLFLVFALVMANLLYLSCGVKLLPNLFSKLTTSEVLKISSGNYFRPISFWFLVALILFMSLNPFFIGKVAIEFSNSLLPQLQ